MLNAFAGAEVNARGPGLWSALHVAARYGHAKAVEKLVAYGAHIEQRSASHFTALHHAAMRGHEAVIASLADAGADLLTMTAEGHTAMDWAERNGHLKGACKTTRRAHSWCCRARAYTARLTRLHPTHPSYAGAGLVPASRR